jgi:hypothetical protein
LSKGQIEPKFHGSHPGRWWPKAKETLKRSGRSVLSILCKDKYSYFSLYVSSISIIIMLAMVKFNLGFIGHRRPTWLTWKSNGK